MTMRKPSYIDHISDIKTEMENRQKSLEKLVKKLETSGWTNEDRELAESHRKWIEENKTVLKNFYKPAMVIAE